MKYLVECNNIFSKKDIYMVNTEGELFYRIKKSKISNVANITIFDSVDNELYKTDYHPFKLKGRYNILNKDKESVVVINTTLKFIYELLFKDVHYIVKGSLWKIHFILYKHDEVIGRVKVIKIHKKRHFEIELLEEFDNELALALLLIAQAIRERS